MDRLGYEDSSFDMSIDLTPMVDVLFMLLIFFITATTFVKPVIDINLATARSAKGGSASSSQVVIVIDAQGVLYMDGNKVELDNLKPIFALQRGKTINLFVDKETPFQSFLAVIDLAKLHNRNDLVVTTTPDTTDAHR
jgi:biopolymer transport protein ExbD